MIPLAKCKQKGLREIMLNVSSIIASSAVNGHGAGMCMRTVDMSLGLIVTHIETLWAA